MEKLKVCMNPSLPTSYTEALSYLEEIGKLRYKLDQVIAAVNAGQTFYILPIATDTTLGGVKAISKTDESHKVAIDADGQIWSAYPTISDDQTLGLVKGTVKTDEDAIVAVDENGEMWYKTPEIATDKIAGIVKAIIKDAQTHKVAIDTDGQLYSDYPNVASTELGLVRGNKKTANQTTPVGIDANGNMFVDTSVNIPQATGTQLGGVKAALSTSDYTGDVRIDSNGELKVKEYTLPVANPSNIGGVKAFPIIGQKEPVGIDPTNNALYSKYPNIANDTVAGIVKAKTKTNETVEVAVDNNGKLYVPANAGIQPASDSVLGGIKAKTRTNEDRKVAIGDDNYAYYRIPQASALEVGGIKADPRNTATDTTEVKIDTTTGKLYTAANGITTIPKATSTTIGGILANPATAEQTVPVGIGNDGQLYTEPVSLVEASKTKMGAVRVSYGGTDTGTLPTTMPAFYPDATNYPLMAGKRVPYSVNTQNGAGLETYGYEVYIDLTETAPDQITGTKLNDYVNYATNHGYRLSIYALDNARKTRQFFDSGKDAGNDRVFTSVPYMDSGNKDKLTITTLIVYADTSGSESYFINDYVIEPTVIGPATESNYGTVKAAKKTAKETAEVKIDTATGKLYAPASGDSMYRLYDCGSQLLVPTTFWTDFLYPCLRAGKLPMIRITASNSSQTTQYTFTCDVVVLKEPLETNIGTLYFRCLQDIGLEEWHGSSNMITYQVMRVPVAIQENYHLSFMPVNISLTVI